MFKAHNLLKIKSTPKFCKIKTNPSLENFTKVLQPFEYHDKAHNLSKIMKTAKTLQYFTPTIFFYAASSKFYTCILHFGILYMYFDISNLLCCFWR